MIDVEPIEEILTGCRSIFIRTIPEAPDFTIGSPFKIVLSTSKGTVIVDITKENLVHFLGFMDLLVFDKEKMDRLYCWDIKSLCSYIHFNLKETNKKFLDLKINVIDLKIIENYLNIKNSFPKNFSEAIDRVKHVFQFSCWQQVYKSIHLPLALKVLPVIETTPLLNEKTREHEYPFYEIEGQVNGRLNCQKKLQKNYLPHNMSMEIKSSFKPEGDNYKFMCSDFKHCEVTVLQWITKDEKLQSLLDSGEDLYKKIYEILTGDECNNDNKRNISKKIFLPVMYGLGFKGLSKNVGISEAISSEIINRIKKNFSSYEWMQQKQEEAKNNTIVDYIGRPRSFEKDKSYLVRNFLIQGVAATVCQEKLIEIHENLNQNEAKIVFSIHDGFGFNVKVAGAKRAYDLVKEICEKESSLCPGLKMKTEIKFGSKLDSMKILWTN